MNRFEDFGIVVTSDRVEVMTTCPQCSDKRRKKNAKCLSVNTDKGVWCCHHCEWSGTLKGGTDKLSKPPKPRIDYHHGTDSPLVPVMLDWFAKRGIDNAPLVFHQISIKSVYMPQVEDTIPCIAFPYYRAGCAQDVAEGNAEVVNIKYRSVEGKHFRQVPHAEKSLFGLENINGESVIITEGELDAMSCEMAGLYSVVSVPDGAPPPGSKPTDQKFEYLKNCASALDPLTKIILAVDSDAPGLTLREELARRLGRDRCWLVTWPEDCKDANDVLLRYGAETLVTCIHQAKPYPVDGLVEWSTIRDKVADLYEYGYPQGVSTGWRSIDPHYTIAPGQVTVVTGIPSHGKSEFLDALMVNVMREAEWRFAVCSPENVPVELHVGKLVEKYTGKPLLPGAHERVPPVQLADAIAWLEQRVFFLLPNEGWTVNDVLTRATALVRQQGIQGLVIDPWNEFEHVRTGGLSETEYVSTTMSEIRRWARLHSAHVWVVAHPQKLYRKDDGSYPVPTPYDISGSAHFRNKADCCVTIWRDEASKDHTTSVYVQKIRFRWIGCIGKIDLEWERVTGRYRDFTEAVSR